jgi:hypothetical protein
VILILAYLRKYVGPYAVEPSKSIDVMLCEYLGEASVKGAATFCCKLSK